MKLGFFISLAAFIIFFGILTLLVIDQDHQRILAGQEKIREELRLMQNHETLPPLEEEEK
jgi:hypothetical protein